jgi:prefoldin subunit 5
MKETIFVLLLILVLSLFNFPSVTKAFTDDDIKVGVFYYPWYVDGNGTGHWSGNTTEANPNLPRTWWTVVDEPVLSWYASSNVSVIRRHLDWFRDAGINFGIISWWGPNSYEDNCTKILFNVTESYAPWFKWVISVEGYREGYDDYNFTDIRGYIENTYVTRYDDIWLHYNNKPLLCWMTAADMTGTEANPKPQNIQNITSDPLFEPRIIGQDSYVNWTSWRPYRGCNITSPYPPSMNEFMCVMPRYDETRLDPQHNTTGAPRNIMCDPHLDGSDGEHVEPLNEPLYDKQWKEVLANASSGHVKYVAIATWNDFTERTQIEPCYDNTSTYGDYSTFLLDKTRYYTSQLRCISLQGQIDLSNQTSARLNESVTSLQEQIGLLNSTLQTLNSAHDALGASINRLQEEYDSLNSSYNILNSSFDDYKTSMQNELVYTRDWIYVLTVIAVVLTATTLYLVVRRPKRRR